MSKQEDKFKELREQSASEVLKAFYSDGELPQDGSELILLNMKCFRAVDQILSRKVGNLTIKAMLEMHYAGRLLIEVEGELPPPMLFDRVLTTKEMALLYEVDLKYIKAGYKKVIPTKDLVKETE